MFTLAKLAYIVCNEDERMFYDGLETTKIDVKPCCIDALEYVKSETCMDNNVDPYDRGFTVGLPIELCATFVFPCTTHSMIEKAAFSGHLECMKFAQERGFPLTKAVCEQAASNGQLECLKYARELLQCPWDELVCEHAAANGHLACLQYAHEQGCPWDEYICEKAAKNGHLECIAYASTNGCPWDEGICDAAAASGHYEILKYARENGCPWDENACLEAICLGKTAHDKIFSKGYDQCLEYVKSFRGNNISIGLFGNL